MGCSDPDEVAQRFPILDPATARRVMEWYHTRREEVDAYMEWVDRKARAVRARLEPRVVIPRRRARHRHQRPTLVRSAVQDSVRAPVRTVGRTGASVRIDAAG